ncbi:PAS domain S-box protein [uncultured Sulfitobacter sp.]|uniref:PAS domain S-box protein n=1 Tax=uncultured Sulfitobacter sp. TaxID=191468 RepID=UPI0026298090|nr:PAS domain S-box protein [uncultured Sulfitobacter sp.]
MVLICLLVSIWGFSYTTRFEQLHAQFQFRKLTMNGVGGINLRIRNYAQVLVGMSAYIATDSQVDVGKIETYMNGLNLEQNAPGLQGFAFIRAVPAQDITLIERATGSPQGMTLAFKSRDQGSETLIVTTFGPESEYGGLIGVDRLAEADVRDALDFARSSRETVLVRSKAMPAKAELLMLQAVYAPSVAAGDTIHVFKGWVMAPFSVETILGGVTSEFGTLYDLNVYQGSLPEVEQALFLTPEEDVVEGHFRHNYTIEQYGSHWLLEFSSKPKFDRRYSSSFPYLLLGMGLAFTALVHSALRATAMRHRSLKLMAELRARQLGAREEENRALLDTSVSVVMVLNEKGQITFANEGAASLFGISQATFKGQNFESVVRMRSGERICDICNAEGMTSIGERLLLDVQTNTWRTAEGTVHKTVLIRDVTEQISSRRAIEALHQRYETALTGAGIGIFDIDRVTGKGELSETWHKIMGTDDLTPPFDWERDFLSRVHPDDLPALIAADRKCFSGEAERSITEYRIRCGEQWRWMYSNAVPVSRSSDGLPTKLIGAQMDITDLREVRHALELSEARFRMVLEDAPVGMAVMNEHGQFIGVNAALATLSGYDVKAMRKSMRLAQLLSRKDFVILSRDVRALLKSDTASTYQNQFQLRTRSGENRWGLFNLNWTYDKNRSENVYIAQIIDITDQKRIEQIKSEFVATVSHELRTPLTSIKGALGLLSVTQPLPEGALRLLDIASVNVDRLTAIVNDILDLEKISSGEVPFAIESLSLEEIAVNAVAQMQEFAHEHGNTLELINNHDGVLVEGDARRLQQVLGSLLSNASKFSDPDTSVVVRTNMRGVDAIIEVENIGPPVPEGFQAHLFNAFTQADGSDTRIAGGAGLGLNIAKQIVLRHGGQIGFERRSGRQTMFWFSCPLAKTTSSKTIEERMNDIAASVPVLP